MIQLYACCHPSDFLFELTVMLELPDSPPTRHPRWRGGAPPRLETRSHYQVFAALSPKERPSNSNPAITPLPKIQRGDVWPYWPSPKLGCLQPHPQRQRWIRRSGLLELGRLLKFTASIIHSFSSASPLRFHPHEPELNRRAELQYPAAPSVESPLLSSRIQTQALQEEFFQLVRKSPFIKISVLFFCTSWTIHPHIHFYTCSFLLRVTRLLEPIPTSCPLKAGFILA